MMKILIIFYFIFIFSVSKCATIGELRNFTIKNFENNSYESFNARCKINTGNSNIWLNDSIPYNTSELNDIHNIFENEIFPTIKNIYGDPPDIDGNNKIHLIITNINDPSNDNLVFFDPYNQYDPSISGYENSNQSEIIYIDYNFYKTNILEFKRKLSIALADLIYFGNYLKSKLFLREGMRMLAPILFSFGVSNDYKVAFEIMPAISLFTKKEKDIKSYAYKGLCFLFFKFLAEFSGDYNGFINQIYQNSNTSEINSTNVIEDSINTITNENYSFNDLYKRFINYLFNPQNNLSISYLNNFYDFPLNYDIHLSNYSIYPIKIKKFWPDYNITITNFNSGSGEELIAYILFYDSNNNLISNETIITTNNISYSPKKDFDNQNGKILIVLYWLGDENQEIEKNFEFSIINSNTKFYYFSNPILKDQILIFFNVLNPEHSIENIELVDPNKNSQNLEVKKITTNTNLYENLKYTSLFTAKFPGKYTIYVKQKDENGAIYFSTFYILIGAYELDENTNY